MNWSITAAMTLLVCVTTQAAELNLGYDSKYISEGRQNIDGGIYWLGAASTLTDALTLSATYGVAAESQDDYDELDLGIEYAVEFGELSTYVGYNRLEFLRDRQSDNELSAGIAYGGLDWFEPFTTYVYSTQANGSFVELGVQRRFSLTSELNITPYFMAAFDYGYASPAHDGSNHTTFGASAEYQLSPQWALNLIAEHQQGHKDVHLDVGDDDSHYWMGVHLITNF